MAESFAVFVNGLTEVDFTKDAAGNIKRAASKAINTITRNKRTRAAKLIRDEVNLPASYVAPGGKGLWVSQMASPGNLQGKITARGRATSLARFVTNNAREGKPGVVVEVAPGKARFMKRAFMIRLPGQAGSTDRGRANMGLAIRLRPGERLANKTSARRVAKGLYVLYGPSVDQVFRAISGDGVANDLIPEIERDLSEEFLRLLEL